MRALALFILLILIFLSNSNTLECQIKGKPPTKGESDTTFIFESPRPLIDKSDIGESANQAWGLDLLFSDNGFGFGAFYQYEFAENWDFITGLYISGARNSDEIEFYNPDENEYRVPDKINRLYMAPLSFGVQRYFFTDVLQESLRPFLCAGLSPATILSTPYNKEFFTAFGYGDLYLRFGAFVGGGANVSAVEGSILNLSVKYYYIPFGDDGLESIKNNPIHNFGGVFLSLTFGSKF